MTHDDLIKLGAEWLTKEIMCRPVLIDYAPMPGEPREDLIGWRWPACTSYVIECKVSTQDMKADSNKKHRIAQHVGDFCYFLVPWVMLRRAKEILPDGWGLLTARKDHTIHRHIAAVKNHAMRPIAERRLLIAASRLVDLSHAVEDARMRRKIGHIHSPERQEMIDLWLAECEKAIVEMGPIKLSTVVKATAESCPFDSNHMARNVLRDYINRSTTNHILVDTQGTCVVGHSEV